MLTLRRVRLGFALVLDLDEGIALLVNNDERPVFHVGLDFRVIETPADKALSVEDCILGIHGGLVLCRITDETLHVSKSHIRGGGAIALFVGDDLNTLRLPDGNAGVAGEQTNVVVRLASWDGLFKVFFSYHPSSTLPRHRALFSDGFLPCALFPCPVLTTRRKLKKTHTWYPDRYR